MTTFALPDHLAFRLAVLDLAGTTVDDQGRADRVLRETVADAAGRDVPDDLLELWQGSGAHEGVAGLLGALGVPAEGPDVEKAYADFAQRLAGSYRDAPPRPLPGVPEAIAELRARGVKVAVQSGLSADLAEPALAGLGPLDAVVAADEVPESRPAPYLVFRCMERTGVHDVGDVLVAGDTPHDLAAGTNAHAGHVVGVLTGSFDAGALGREPHTHLLPSVAGLPSLLG